ncbi:hypothetical protein TA3x_002791 [Tundrisphaera sp. TA3]|uniref:hypothetical protein n=1 Tax=Tundrisphaera sp. TA3 TaxID=3435775 RepID=UPI003EBD4C40
MPARSHALSRIGLWSMAALLLLLAPARPASAAGCHGPDRPQLDYAWAGDAPSEAPSTVDPAPTPISLRHAPCPGEPAEVSPRTSPIVGSGPGPRLPDRPDRSPTDLAALLASESLISSEFASRMERPPRATTAAA